MNPPRLRSRHGMIFETGVDVAPSGASDAMRSHDCDEEDSPLQRPRPPERVDSVRPPHLTSVQTWLPQHKTNTYTCREVVCLCLVPCLVLGALALAVSNFATYFLARQEMSTENANLRRQLEEQLQRDGGIFMSLQSKREMDKSIGEFQQLHKEHRRLTDLLAAKGAEAERLQRELSSTQTTVAALRGQLAKNNDLTKDAIAMREVADQQYHEKEEVFKQDYKRSSADLEGQRAVVSYGAHATEKTCASLRGLLDVPLDLGEQHAQEIILAETTRHEETKRALSLLDSDASGRVEASQRFLSRLLETAAATSDRAAKLRQEHLERAHKWAERHRASAHETIKATEAANNEWKLHISMADERCANRAQKQKDLLLTADTKQDDLLSQAEHSVDTILETVQHYASLFEIREKRILDEIDTTKQKLKALESWMEEERHAHRKTSETLQKAARETLKTAGEAAAACKAAHKSEMAHMAAFATDAVQRNAKMWARLGDFVGGALQRAQSVLRAAETRLSEEDSYVDKQSEEESKRKDAAEATTREKADEENKWLAKMREPIQSQLKLSAEALKQTELVSEGKRATLSRWREDARQHLDQDCGQIRKLDHAATHKAAASTGQTGNAAQQLPTGALQ